MTDGVARLGRVVHTRVLPGPGTTSRVHHSSLHCLTVTIRCLTVTMCRSRSTLGRVIPDTRGRRSTQGRVTLFLEEESLVILVPRVVRGEESWVILLVKSRG